MQRFLSHEKVESLKKQYPPGTRIQLHHMGDDPRPVPDGMTGTVNFVDDIGTIHCSFDNGRSLGLIPGEDSFSILASAEDIAEEQENQISM